MKKYYLVPADIIESNFPDDMEQLAPSIFEVNTALGPEAIITVLHEAFDDED